MKLHMHNPTAITSTSTSCALWQSLFLLYVIPLLSLSFSLIKANALLGNETDRLALLKFKESISNDPHGVLRSWSEPIHFCSWNGVTCGHRHQRVTALNLEGSNLRGTISPYIRNLTFLSSINLMNNSFFGEIPHQVCRLSRLQNLSLGYNMLEGELSAMNLSYCSELRALGLTKNRVTGVIPSELGILTKLVLLNLDSNNLTGEIPPSLGNMSSLEQFYVQTNKLVGTVPDELGKLKRLEVFATGANSLSGMIPLSLYNISSLRTLSITDNQLEGNFPPNIGLTLPNLQDVYAGGNKFSGVIPESLSNASQLQNIDVSENNFVGQVPASFGVNLPDLRRLNLEHNNLGNYSADSLDFIASLANCSKLEGLSLSTNNFGGVLPNSISNLSTSLTQLYFSRNLISGNIPETLADLVNLIILSLSYNLFQGVIPDSLGKLENLQALVLDGNTLSGKIPSSLVNLTQIAYLALSENNLEGSITPKLADCQYLQYLEISQNNLSGTIPVELFSLSSLYFLNLSQNGLTGSLPGEVGKLRTIRYLHLSENNMAGEIPETIGDCESLELLSLRGNFFQGNLPSSLASLRGLQYLDLSQNNLTGKIPKDLQNLPVLEYLNISFNDLEGEVPNEGIFQNTTAISIVGNIKLCGGVSKLQLPRCPKTIESKQGKGKGLKRTIIIVCVTASFLLFASLIFLFWRRKSTGQSQSEHSTIGFLSKVSYQRLHQATNGFSQSMLIGTGAFGSVYKGVLDHEENIVAVKVLNLHQKGASKSFIAECNALRNIRHRNLVKILTCCSSQDYNGNEFKALVFEYMSNGSLEKMLHMVNSHENQSRGLSLIQRLNIASDVASAIYYLHDHSDNVIIHCDLKPSNVLLDNEMTAHVSDFGLARLMLNTTGISESQTSTTGIKGTIGYAPPGNFYTI
ncbi:Serine/threonine protein kinase [Parasponia andersonii]|uniref:non-specific serine/threonine protein kinase n=1 Tax=Parasponia andersonii TaxID=3476 RepID=A0A2P5A7I5_PARAD|nr:Serine/threonine protein kinase [Parasponia andersonii]